MPLADAANFEVVRHLHLAPSSSRYYQTPTDQPQNPEPPFSPPKLRIVPSGEVGNGGGAGGFSKC